MTFFDWAAVASGLVVIGFVVHEFWTDMRHGTFWERKLREFEKEQAAKPWNVVKKKQEAKK